MGGLLNVSSILTCPHGGLVSAVPSTASVSVAGAPVVLATDTFTIAGCPFSTPGGPHPCMLLHWQLPAARSTSGGSATLTAESVGFCKAADGAVQGTVLVQSTQPQVTGL